MPLCICVFQWDSRWCPTWFNDLVLGRTDPRAPGIDAEGESWDVKKEAFRTELTNTLGRCQVLSAMLVFIPIGILTHLFGCPPWIVFTANFCSILPMAWLIGKATEDLASHTSEILGGLLNASFGNIVEMLLCIAGIRANEVILIQCTLIGSILSNMLLVMGTAFIVGGIKHHVLYFSEVSSNMQSSLMLLSVLGVSLPTMYSVLVPGNEAIEPISRTCAILLFGMYLQFLLFQLWTHADFIEEEEKAVQKPLPAVGCGRAGRPRSGSNESGRESQASKSIEDDSDDEDEVDLGFWNAMIVLGLCTVLTAFCSDFLIGSMEGFMESWQISREFIGIIILPIIGNAAEHWTAILSAWKGKTDLAIGVAVGSSCQMALFVTPFTVLVGWVVQTPMTLDFHPFQAIVLLLSVLIVANILKENESNWLIGSMLCTAYVSIALIYFKADPYISPVVQYGVHELL